MKDLTDEIYDCILKEYKESGYELYDEMFLTQFTYVGGYQQSTKLIKETN